MSLVTGLFFLVLPLNQQWSPPLTLQASHCSIFRIMCDFPSIAFFCSESIECFPGTVSKFFFKFVIIMRYGCLCHRHFFLVLPLNQQWSPQLTLQASHCSTFRIMCDVPSIAVFCSESIDFFPGTASKLFLKFLVNIPVAPIITGIIIIIIIIIITIIIL